MNSRIYECRVLHARFVPKPHRFAYRLFMLAVDLDELPALHRRLRLFSVNRANFYSFRENDFLPTSEPLFNPSHSACATSPTANLPPSLGVASPALTVAPLKARVLAFFASHGVDLGPGGRVVLVALPRVLGYSFNPVSFYYGYDASGSCLGAIAEVTNTFREMKPYFVGSEASPGEFRLRTPKFFYVSPFSDVDVAFDFHLSAPTEKLAVQIDDYVGTQRTLTSSLHGPSSPLTDARLAWFTLKYPLLTLRIIGLIHWHALRLFLKKIPWFPKSARPDDQRDLYHPHASLTHDDSASPDRHPNA
ncbi:MAG: DUF1365 domain-containing protein [Opitutus sp.]|nr:DUF1365 domain-containing protein [Opitutus sp.]MCS6245872.1 DUF1365 domain-containing protein [Opitutus sp.]MCS6273595.1 DUF1365 domain-containing protein [Opitutus sp.]MCS6276049.1 DUF1365 domain-containing protein [Opitutus sp.]MCS6301144.1 DUF1365 domain-containing protein [Opitutus sp.]